MDAATPGNKTYHVILGGVVFVVVAVTIIYALSQALTGTIGGAVAGGVVGLLVAVFSKAFEHRKLREAAIAEKKREVYRRLLEPWERMIVDIRAGKSGEELLEDADLAKLYASAFDTVLYGSETVLKNYVEFRNPDSKLDSIDHIRSFAKLLISMREDVTGKKTTLSEESVLRTFVNFAPEELVVLQLREYVAKNPEAQRKLAEVLRGGASDAKADTDSQSAG